jgi:hypothetical protein
MSFATTLLTGRAPFFFLSARPDAQTYYYHSCRSLNIGAWELGIQKTQVSAPLAFFALHSLCILYKKKILGNFAITTFLHRHIEWGKRPSIRSDFGALAGDNRRGKLVADHPW